MTKEPFTVWFNNVPMTIGTVTYEVIHQDTIVDLDNEAKEIMNETDEDYFSINPTNAGNMFNSIKRKIGAIINTPAKHIYYFWLTSDNTITVSAKYIYIITLYSDDWIGTTLDVEVTDKAGRVGRTRKYTKSEYLYPDEREEHDHYYDGGCLIWLNVEEFTQVRIKALNCLILTF